MDQILMSASVETLHLRINFRSPLAKCRLFTGVKKKPPKAVSKRIFLVKAVTLLCVSACVNFNQLACACVLCLADATDATE